MPKNKNYHKSSCTLFNQKKRRAANSSNTSSLTASGALLMLAGATAVSANISTLIESADTSTGDKMPITLLTPFIVAANVLLYAGIFYALGKCLEKCCCDRRSHRPSL